MTSRRLNVWWATGLVLAIGCSKSPTPEEKPKGTPAPPEPPAATIAVPPPPKIEKGPEVQPPALSEDKPEELAKQLLAAIKENKPEVLWFALPASYQAQIQKQITTFATQVDPDVWHMVGHTLRSICGAATKQSANFKKHWLLDNFPVPRDRLVQAWDGAVSSGTVLAASELCDVNELKNLDVPRFLAKTGSAVMQQLPKVGEIVPGFDYFTKLEWAKKLKVVKSTKAGDAVVITFESPGEPPFDEVFVQVEGNWLPKRLVDGWPDVMKKIDESFASLDFGKDIRLQQAKLDAEPKVEASTDEKGDTKKPSKPPKTPAQKKHELLNNFLTVAGVFDLVGNQKSEADFNRTLEMSAAMAAMALKKPEWVKRKPPAVANAQKSPSADKPQEKPQSKPAEKK